MMTLFSPLWLICIVTINFESMFYILYVSIGHIYDLWCVLYGLLNKQVTCCTPANWFAFDHISVSDVWPLVLWQFLLSSTELWYTGNYLVASFDERLITLMNGDGCIDYPVATLDAHISLLQWYNSTFFV